MLRTKVRNKMGPADLFKGGVQVPSHRRRHNRQDISRTAATFGSNSWCLDLFHSQSSWVAPALIIQLSYCHELGLRSSEPMWVGGWVGGCVSVHGSLSCITNSTKIFQYAHEKNVAFRFSWVVLRLGILVYLWNRAEWNTFSMAEREGTLQNMGYPVLVSWQCITPYI
jgi:hypothetical protein